MAALVGGAHRHLVSAAAAQRWHRAARMFLSACVMALGGLASPSARSFSSARSRRGESAASRIGLARTALVSKALGIKYFSSAYHQRVAHRRRRRHQLGAYAGSAAQCVAALIILSSLGISVSRRSRRHRRHVAAAAALGGGSAKTSAASIISKLLSA